MCQLSCLMEEKGGEEKGGKEWVGIMLPARDGIYP